MLTIILITILNYKISLRKKSLTKHNKRHVLKQRRLHRGLNPDRLCGKRSTYSCATEAKCNCLSKTKHLTKRCNDKTLFTISVGQNRHKLWTAYDSLMKLHRWAHIIKLRVIVKNENSCSFSFLVICPWSIKLIGRQLNNLKEQEVSFLPMTHILISWIHLWRLYKLFCTVQATFADFTLFTNWFQTRNGKGN